MIKVRLDWVRLGSDYLRLGAPYEIRYEIKLGRSAIRNQRGYVRLEIRLDQSRHMRLDQVRLEERQFMRLDQNRLDQAQVAIDQATSTKAPARITLNPPLFFFFLLVINHSFFCYCLSIIDLTNERAKKGIGIIACVCACVCMHVCVRRIISKICKCCVWGGACSY